ncbi:MAG: ATPase domain-containing protein [Candidatus Methanoperedens sp.]|nr:ATPase domain-containing protein [Candidatus Methanoperedens sp.]
MFKNSINGLNELFKDDCDIPRGSVILVSGSEGALKSGFVFNIISSYLEGCNEHGLYATLEETEESLLRNMKSLGIKKSDRLHVFDYKDVRLEWETEDPDMVKVTEDLIDFYKEKYETRTVFALDSLNAFYSLTSQVNLRRKMYHFFTMLRDKNLTSFLIMEKCSLDGHFNDYIERPEYFLADGIIELGIVETKENVKRYIQIRKMRGANHSMEKHQIVVGKKGLSILGMVY